MVHEAVRLIAVAELAVHRRSLVQRRLTGFRNLGSSVVVPRPKR